MKIRIPGKDLELEIEEGSSSAFMRYSVLGINYPRITDFLCRYVQEHNKSLAGFRIPRKMKKAAKAKRKGRMIFFDETPSLIDIKNMNMLFSNPAFKKTSAGPLTTLMEGKEQQIGKNFLYIKQGE